MLPPARLPRCRNLSASPRRRGPHRDAAPHLLLSVRSHTSSQRLSVQAGARDQAHCRAAFPKHEAMDSDLDSHPQARPIPVRRLRAHVSASLHHPAAAGAPHRSNQGRVAKAPRPREPHHPVPGVPRAGRARRHPSRAAPHLGCRGERARRALVLSPSHGGRGGLRRSRSMRFERRFLSRRGPCRAYPPGYGRDFRGLT